MKFNRVILMRLYHIAFFMPDALEKIDQDRLSCESEERDKMHVPYYEDESYQKDLFELMNITNFEKDLFLICKRIFENISPVFFPFEDKYTKQNDSTIADNPAEFLKTIPHGIISTEDIEKKSYNAFSSLRSACYFYCRFIQSYYLYSFSDIINKQKNQIPFLKYIKNNLYAFFSNYPIVGTEPIHVYLDDLADSAKAFMHLGKMSKDMKPQEYLKSIDKIVVDCMDVTNTLVSGVKTNKKITVVEKKRRKGISKKKKEIFSERRKKILTHVRNIRQLARVRKASIKATCEDYLPKHRQALKEIGINKCSTLENHCIKKRTDPNKQRSAFSAGLYVEPEYSSPLKTFIKELRSNHPDLFS